MMKSTEDLISLLGTGQNVIILANQYSTQDIITMLRHMGPKMHMTIRGAAKRSTSDLVQIAQNSQPGTITFDFTEPGRI